MEPGLFDLACKFEPLREQRTSLVQDLKNITLAQDSIGPYINGVVSCPE